MSCPAPILEGMEPGDVERNPDGSLELIQPPVCPVGHPLPRIHWQLCSKGGHHMWICSVRSCKREIHARHECQASGDQAGS